MNVLKMCVLIKPFKMSFLIKNANLCLLTQMCPIVQIKRENHLNITEPPAFVVGSVTIFLHNVAVLLECIDNARKSGILQLCAHPNSNV